MFCPKCKKEMIVVERNDVELDYCMFCEGFWFDWGEWNILCKKLIAQDFLDSPSDVYDIPAAITGEKPRRCPVCGEKMEKFMLCGDILIDRCKNRHGLWFDKNEFSACVNSMSSKTNKEQIELVLAVVIIAIIAVIGIYNGLVRLKNQVKNAYSQIEVQLKRRHDLIPNLVETVKGYMEHERETLEKVVNARNIATKISPDAKIQSENENMLSGALKSLFALSENYPDLKANQNFLSLQEEISTTENKIAFARQFYNDSVMHYNNKKEVFPNNLIVSMFHFEPFSMFEIQDVSERENVKVSFK